MKRSWGRDYIPDKRDRRFSIPHKRSDRVRKMWTSRWVGDQGSTSQCVGFAWTGWLSGPPIRQFLNPDGIYHLAQHCDEWEGEDYEGTSVRGAAKVLKSLGLISEYQWAFDADSVAITVLERAPVVIGIRWYAGLSQPDPSTHFIYPTGRILGGHAILVDGVDTRKGYFRLQNSWGRRWGNNGRCFILIDDLDRLIRENGEACIGVESRPMGR